MPTNVYIDGFNFYFGAVKRTAHKWVDLEALARLLVPNDTLGTIHYFTAHVGERYTGDETPRRQAVYLRALRTNPRINIVLGHYKTRSKWRSLDDRKTEFNGLLSPALEPHDDAQRLWELSKLRRTEPFASAYVILREEKGSDVNLAVQLLWDTVQGNCDKALVISNDSDLEDAIRKSHQLGCTIGIVNPQRQATNRRLLEVANFEIPFRREILGKCQLPDTVRTEKGRQLHRPAAWR